jgi:zeta-carotene desaturase
MKTALIIGSGMAGLSTAFHLTKAGIKVHIIESSNHLGGRLTALFDSKSEEMIDNGQHAIMTAYQSFLQIINELNTSKLLNFQKHLKVTYLDIQGKYSQLNCGYLPGKLGMAIGFILLKGISFKSKISIIRLLQNLSEDLEKYNGLTCLEFLNINNQGNDAITRFWEPFVVATMNSNLDTASARILVNILTKAFIKDINNSKLVFPKVELPALLTPILNYIIENGGEISYNSKAEKLEILNNKVIGIHTKNEFFKTDYVISTIQPFSLIKIIPVEFVESFSYLKEFQYSPITSIYIWMDESLFDNDFLAILGSPIQWIFNRRKLIESNKPLKYKESYSITISSSDNLIKMNNSQIIELIFDELTKCFPKFDKSSVLHHRIITEKFATFLQTPDSDKIRPNSKTIIENLFLAGDWTNTQLPATIESAALSGKFAASIIN